MRTSSPIICKWAVCGSIRAPRGAGRSLGFSLIEILVVIGLMALITGIMIPAFTSAFRVSGESYAKKLALQLGQARDRAMLTDKLVRLKIDFEKQTMTLEETSSQQLVPKIPEHAPSDREKEELEKKEAELFRFVSEISKEPMKMPNGLKIIQVDSPRYKKPVRDGVALVYFFNNGNTDGATIYFESDEKTHNSITLHPVTGMSRFDTKAPEGI